MCDILIKAIDAVHPDPTKDRTGSYKRGYIVEAFPDYHLVDISGKFIFEGCKPPSFAILRVSDATVEQAHNYIISWTRRIDYEVVNQNLTLDGYRIGVFATNPSTTDQGVGAGKITRVMVESFLNKWGATVFAIADNSVTFDITVYNAIKSEGFWNVNLSQVIFLEIAYVQANGIHTIQVNYSGTAYTRAQVINKITQTGGTVISESVGTVQFTITRNIVLNAFRQDVRSKIETILYRRQYYLPSNLVTSIENSGGLYTTTRAELIAAIRNRVSE